MLNVNYGMDNYAYQLLSDYLQQRLYPGQDFSQVELYIVWKCKALQNWKYLMSTNIIDDRYYELTYNGDKHEWYIDSYQKTENFVVTDAPEVATDPGVYDTEEFMNKPEE